MTAKSSREAMRRHAIYRLFERKGIALTIGAYERVCAELAHTQKVPAAAGYGGRVFHLVRIRSVDIFACWDLAHGCIVTFVPQLPTTAQAAPAEAAA